MFLRAASPRLVRLLPFLLACSRQCFARMEYDSRFAGVVVVLCD